MGLGGETLGGPGQAHVRRSAPDWPEAIWHEVECGSYTADLNLWRELAASQAGGVLDVGAGSGRVALALARGGHEVVALDTDRALLDILAGLGRDLPVRCVQGDARDFQLERSFGLIVVPMQTIQLLGGASGRARFLACARTHLAGDGLLAVAIAEELEPFGPAQAQGMTADLLKRDAVVYASRPVAVRVESDRFVLERVREMVTTRGERTCRSDSVVLDRLTAAALEAEAAELGLRVRPRRTVPPTPEHVGSTVVMLGA